MGPFLLWIFSFIEVLGGVFIDEYGTKGSTLVFVCSHRNVSELGVQWSFLNSNGSTTVYTVNNATSQELPSELFKRISVVGNQTIGEYNLEIKDIRESDDGIYQCDNGPEQKQHRLFFIILGRVNYGSEHSAVVLICPYRKVPEHSLQWTKVNADFSTTVYSIDDRINNQTIPQELYSRLAIIVSDRVYKLQIFDTRKSDEGNYRCHLGLKQDLQQVFTIPMPCSPIFSTDPIIIEESNSFMVSCTSVGSRPAATFRWFVGRTAISSGYTTESSLDTVNDTYTVTSTLTSSVNRTYNSQNITCIVANLDGSAQARSILYVKFAPDITVPNTTYNQSTTTRTLTCIPVGNPTTYTYYKWQHKSTNGVLIRELDGGQDGILTLPTVTLEASYQDSGEYVCTAENGITDITGMKKQKGSGYVEIYGQQIITKENKPAVYSEIGKNVDIYVYVYSVPKYTSIRWYKSDIQISQSGKYTISELKTIVNDTHFGTDVQIEVYRVTLTIKNLSASDISSVRYKVEISNDLDKSVEYTQLLLPTSSPHPPSKMKLIMSFDTSIVIQWDPGDNGGYEQRFYVEYRASGLMTWLAKECSDTLQSGTQIYVLSGLDHDTLYELRMYAENAINRSSSTSIKTIQTQPSDSKLSSSWTIIGGVAGGLSSVIVIQFIFIVILMRRRREFFCRRLKQTSLRETEDPSYQHPSDVDILAHTTNKQSDKKKKVTELTREYETLGMKDNPHTYSDLPNFTKFESTAGHYESLGDQDKARIYETLTTSEGQALKE